MRCGKEKESNQQSALSIQPKTIYRKGRKERKGTGRKFHEFDDARVDHTQAGGLSVLCVLGGKKGFG